MKKLASVLAAFALVATLGACASQSALRCTSNDETRGIDIEATNAEDMLEEKFDIEIAEGECLVVSPVIEGKGSIKLHVLSQGAEVTTIEAAGKVMTAYALEPGAYQITVEGAGATGTVAVMPYSIADIEAQNASLGQALTEAMGAEGAGVMLEDLSLATTDVAQ